MLHIGRGGCVEAACKGKANERRVRAHAYVLEAEDRFSDMERQIRDLEVEVAEGKRAVRLAENEKRQTALLLKTRTAELQEAHVYLDKVDDTSDCEVMRCVANLNSAIFQAAAAIADSFHKRCRISQDAEVVVQANVRLNDTELLCEPLLNAIQSFDHVGDPIVMQTALQALAATYLQWLCSTWDFLFGDGPSLLEQTYSKIRGNGTYHWQPQVSPKALTSPQSLNLFAEGGEP